MIPVGIEAMNAFAGDLQRVIFVKSAGEVELES